MQYRIFLFSYLFYPNTPFPFPAGKQSPFFYPPFYKISEISFRKNIKFSLIFFIVLLFLSGNYFDG